MGSFLHTENWDDDFEFQKPSSSSRTATHHVNDDDQGNPRMSFASTTDWDKDNDDLSHEPPSRRPHILEDKKNILDDWSESPHRQPRSFHNPTTPTRPTENWDDDFLDSHSPPWFPPPPSNPTTPSRKLGVRPRLGQLQTHPRPESWDDEFANVSPPRPSPSKRPRYPSTYSSSSEDEDEDGGTHDLHFDLGYPVKDEEDHTVTARSRRAALSKLTSTPPPPVPSLPLSLPLLLPPSSSSTFTISSNINDDPQPFPRSPTSSVFSIPISTTNARPPSSAYTVTSQTLLRPLSRSSSGLGGLPSSPPVHRERERRRLRKKSRPQGAGRAEVYEMRDVSLYPGDVLDGDEDLRLQQQRGYPYASGYEYGMSSPALPTTAAVAATMTTTSPTGSASTSPGTSANTGSGAGATLLSRIGSVKKWGVRRKKGSMPPAQSRLDTDVQTQPQRTHKEALEDFELELDLERHLQATSDLTPRPARRPVSEVSSSTGSASVPPHDEDEDRDGHGVLHGAASIPPASPTPARKSKRRSAGSGLSPSPSPSAPPSPLRTVHTPDVGARNPSHISSRNTSGNSGVTQTTTSTSRNTSGTTYTTGTSMTSATSIGNSRSSSSNWFMRSVSASHPTSSSLGSSSTSYTGSGSGVRPRPGTSAGSGASAGTRYESGSGLGSWNGYGSRGASTSDLGLDSDVESRNKRHTPPIDLRKTPTRPSPTPPPLMNNPKYGGWPPYSPTKLVKRKSLGFVQLKLGFGGHGDRDGDKDRDRGWGGGWGKEKDKEEESKRPVLVPNPQLQPQQHSSSRSHVYGKNSGGRNMQVSYAGLGVGRAAGVPVPGPGAGVVDSEDERLDGRGREETETEKDTHSGMRGFVGSVRRISMGGGGDPGAGVGKHRKSKSGGGVSISGLHIGGNDKDNETLGFPDPLSPPLNKIQGERIQEHEHELLPPIELHPPSPPQTIGKGSGGTSVDVAVPLSSTSASIVEMASTLSPSTSVSGVASPVSPARRALAKTPGSPGQTSSLGRSSGVGGGGSGSGGIGTGGTVGVVMVGGLRGDGGSGGVIAPVLRRSSLGDLKIPERISQAQVSLRRDLGMVREFAANVEQLKGLQATYHGLVGEVQIVLDAHALQHQRQQQQQQSQPQSRASSPSFLTGLTKPKSRNRSNTNPQPPSSSVQTQTKQLQSKFQALHEQGAYHFQHPQLAYKQLASAFYTINSKYRISWECAELLIDLAGGSTNNNGNGTGQTQPSTSVSAPVMGAAAGAGLDLNLSLHLNLIAKKGSGGRERAITLAGDESKPSSPVMGASPLGPGAGIGGGDALMRASSPPLASPPSLAWRASTGRHDLSHRQLVLLRDMLHNTDSGSALNMRPHVDEHLHGGGLSIPEEQPMLPATLNVNREWRWGDAMSSTVTLPSEESGRSSSDPRKKRRHSRLGMSGLRDMLRSLKRQTTDAPPLPPPPVPASSTSLSTENSSMEQGSQPPLVQGRRRAKTSSGPDSVWMARSTSPYSPSSLTSKPSPRRPSLASIFRIGHKIKQPVGLGTEDNRPPRSTSSQSKSANSSPADGEEEDWDRLDSASDMDAAARALGIKHDNPTSGLVTVREKGKGKGKGKSPYLQNTHHHPPPLPPRPLTPKRSASASQSSIWDGGLDSSNGGAPGSGTPPPIPGARSTRLSNVEEHSDDYRHPSSSNMKRSKVGVISPSSSSRDPKSPKNGSVRSMPPHPISNGLPDSKLEMTPENIKPLLENAKEVHARLNECIAEIRSLLRMHADPRIMGD